MRHLDLRLELTSRSIRVLPLRSAVAVLVALVAALVVPAAETSAAPLPVGGMIVDEVGVAVEGVTVAALDSSASPVATDISGLDGHFQFTIEPGIYDIELSTPDRTLVLDAVTLSPDEPVTLVLFAEGGLVPLSVVGDFSVGGVGVPTSGVNFEGFDQDGGFVSGSNGLAQAFDGAVLDIAGTARLTRPESFTEVSYQFDLVPIDGPTELLVDSELSEVTFRVTDSAGTPVVEYTLEASIATPNLDEIRSVYVDAFDQTLPDADAPSLDLTGEVKVLIPIGASSSEATVTFNGTTINFTIPMVDEPSETFIVILGPGGTTVVVSDRDNDLVADEVDNCPFDANTDQADSDGDGIGDVCDDTSPPEVTGAAAVNAAGWVNDLDSVIVWTATDPAPSLGISNTGATTGGLVEGVATYRSPELCDDQGNCATGELEVSVDATAPAVILNSPPDGGSVLVTNFAPPTCTATDALSGLDGECAVSLSEPIDQPGTLTYTAVATASDIAGNEATITSTFIVLLDVDAPTITVTTDVDANDAGWWRNLVTFSFTCADTQSLVVSCPDPITVDTEGANQSFTVAASDSAGNVGELVVAGINVDTTDPTLTITATAPTGGVFGFDDIIGIGCDANDVLSGIEAVDCPDAELSGADLGVGTHVLTATASDVAGNSTRDTITIAVALDGDYILDVAAGFVDDEGNGANGLLNPLGSHLSKTPEPNWQAACLKINKSKLLTDDEKAVLNGLLDLFAASFGTTISCSEF